MNITKEYIEVNDKVYLYKNIKNIDYIVDKYSLLKAIQKTILNITFLGIVYIIMIVPIFFITNIYTVFIASISIIGIISTLIPYKTKYSIFIGVNEIYKTENEKEFINIKNEIKKNLI